MKVFILALGTRGDVAPLFLLAGALAARDHDVVLGTSAFFAPPAGVLPTRRLAVGDGGFDALTDAMRAVAAMPERSERDMAFVQRWMLPQIAHAREAIDACLAGSDYAVTNIPRLLRRPGSDAIMPGAFVTYEPPHPPGWLPQLGRGEVLSLAAVSPLLLDPAGALCLDRRVTGFWRGPPAQGPLDDALQRFLATGSAPVVLTLGSMGVFEGPSLAQEFLAALRASGRRGLLVGGWGQLDVPADADGQLLIVEEADYDMLLPRCALVIHHGGSGTVAAVLRAGIPCVLRPYIGSQQRYADLLMRHGVCTGVLDAPMLTAADLAHALRQGLDDAPARAAARRWRDAVALEQGCDGLARATALIESHARLLAIARRPTMVAPMEDVVQPVATAPDTVTAPAAAPPAVPTADAAASNLDARIEALRAQLPPPAPDEIQRFYEANPGLFAGRKLYELRRIGLPASAMDEASTAAALQTAASVSAWTQWLENQGIPYRAEAIRCAAEEVPSDLFPILAAMSPGQWVRVDEPQRATVLELVSAHAAPRALADAAGDIARFLHNLAVGRLVQAEGQAAAPGHVEPATSMLR